VSQQPSGGTITGPGGRIAVVAAALLDDLSRPRTLLTAQRTEPPRLAGGWELPGGKVDPGEDLMTALAREIREELGVEITVGQHIPGPLEGWWPLGASYALAVWTAGVRDGIPQPLEDHAQLRWLTRADLWSVPWLASNSPIVEAVAATVWNRPASPGPAPTQ